MVGMKIRFTRNRILASSKAKGATYGILLFLAVVAPQYDIAQDKTQIPGAIKQSNPASNPQSAGASDAAKATPGAKAAATLPAASITDIKIAPEGKELAVTVATDRLIAPKEFTLEDPSRLVLDFPNTENKVKFNQLTVGTASVKQVRVQQFQIEPSLIARVVFDLEENFGAHETTVDKNLVRLVFHEGKAKANPVSPGPMAKPAPSQAENSSKQKASPSQPNSPQSTEKSKIAVNDLKPLPAESLKNPVAPAPAAASRQEQVSPRPEPVKYAVASVNPKPRTAETVAPIHPTPASKTAAQPKQVSSQPEPAGVPVPGADPKPRTAEPVVKSPAAQASSSASQPEQTASRPETARASVAGSNPKPNTMESAGKDAAAQAPLVAALAAAPIAAPPRMPSAPNSRFTGQPLTLDLIDIPLVDFFRLMAEEGGVNIVLDPEVKGHLSMKVVKVPWDQIFEAALSNNGLDKQVEGPLIRIARKSTLQEEAKQEEALKKATLLAADLQTNVRRLNYAKANTLVNVLADQKTVRGTIVVEERTNSLVLTDLPDSVKKLNQLIDTLDVPQPQVEIEARIVSAARDFARDIGVQWGFVAGNLQRVTVGGPNTFGTIGGSRPSATPTSTYVAGNPYSGRGAADSSSTDSGSVSTGIGGDAKGNYNVNLPATKAFGGLGISVGNIFDTFLLDAAITAGESKGMAKLISQPKVIAQNNNPAIVTQGLRFPVQIIANNTITVQFQNAALTLTVTPQITYEGNIILDLKVENNTPDFGLSVNNIPSIRTSESATRVLVSDGGTTVIGGILIDDESMRKDGIPWLGTLPGIGHLFRRDAVSRTTQEVLFFVTPRIVK